MLEVKEILERLNDLDERIKSNNIKMEQEHKRLTEKIEQVSRDVSKMNNALLGSKEYNQKGIVDRLNELETKTINNSEDIKKAKWFGTIAIAIGSFIAWLLGFLKN
jgi:Mg2+ and Co2+ transporter CorA